MGDQLVVFMGGVLAGEISRHKGQFSFKYDRDYIDSHHYPLSPVLPVSESKHKSHHIDSFVAGLVPENPNTRAEWARTFGVRDTAFDLLGEMGLDCAGAVQFANPERVSEITKGGSLKPLTEQDIAQRIHDLIENEDSWTMPSEHWSLPGQQGKFALTWDGEGWCSAHGSAATTHIFKPGITTLKHQALVEHVTMACARHLGLAVAETDMVTFGEQVSLVTKRFDRISGGTEIERLHQVDFCQALGRMPDAKYEENGGSRPKEIAAMLRKVSTSPESDVKRFSDALMFNYVVGAPDAHSKNYSLLFAGSQVRLAPLYDVATAFPYDPKEEGMDLRTVAMSIGGRRKLGDVDLRGWKIHATEMGLFESERVERLDAMTAQVVGAFEEVLDEVKDLPGALEVRNRLLPNLTDHVNATRTKAGLPSTTTRSPAAKNAATQQTRGKTTLSSNSQSFSPAKHDEAPGGTDAL